MSQSSYLPSPRLVTQAKQDEVSGDQTNLRTIQTQRTAYQDALSKLKNYSPKSSFIDIDKLKSSPHLKIKKGKDFIYFGQIKDRKRNGMGILLHDNGKIYEGSWCNDEKEGQGYELFTSKNQYFGQYRNGKPHGLGKYEWHNGQIYEGEWQEGQRHGSGTWKGTNNTSYVGEWKNGKPEGFGVLVWSQGDRYQGYFKENLKHGEGYERYASGDLYRGNFELGKKQGYGEYFWQNGSYYKGTFVDGLRDGQGIWHSKIGDTYEGQYKAGKKQGYGIYKWHDGTVYKGNFKNELRQGFGQMRWQDGSYYKGGWQKNIQNGIGQIYSKGKLKQCRLVNNVVTQLDSQEDDISKRSKMLSTRQKQYNKHSRDNNRYRVTHHTPDGFRRINFDRGEVRNRVKTEGNVRPQWRSLAQQPKDKASYENVHFKLNPSRMKKTEQFKLTTQKARTQYRSQSQKNHIPHSSFLPHQMHHRRIHTSNSEYSKEQKDQKLTSIVEKPYNLTKLMHRFKLVRSIQQQH